MGFTKEGALAQFHPLNQKVVQGKMGAPTTSSHRLWPEIAQGRHVLATDPATGKREDAQGISLGRSNQPG